MSNAWLQIPLQDYEAHMSLPSIGQARMLADQLERLLNAHSPRSLALLGCAGGNGLERIGPEGCPRIVAVDINPEYLQLTAARHAARLPGLQLLCADIESESLSFEPVELVYAGLLFEYLEPAAALRSIQRICQPGGVLATVLQLPTAAQPAVSPSPYRNLERLAGLLRLLAPQEFAARAAAAGFFELEAETLTLPSGKSFWLQLARYQPQ